MEEETKSCPFCGKIIKKEAKKCRFCNNWLAYDTETISNRYSSIEQAPTAKSDQIIEDYIPSTIPCPYCGEEILSTAKKCKHCQSWLEDGAVNNTNSSKIVLPREEINGECITKVISEIIGGLVTLGILWWLYSIACDELAESLESFARSLPYY